MRLRSFYGTSLSDAIEQVRMTLGDNAIIISSRDEENGNVRVTAAIDDKIASTLLSENEAGGAFAFSQNNESARDVGSEILEKMAQILLAHNVPHALAERLLAATMQFAKDDPVLALGSALDAHLCFGSLRDDPDSHAFIFVGLPGSGKTLSLSKYATKAVLSQQNAALINTDFERAGAAQQIQAFARVLKMKLIEAQDAPALGDSIALMPPKQLLLIDTPGCNPLNNKDRERTRGFIESSRATPVLVLPADMESLEAIDSIRAFQSMGVKKAIVTRVDLVKRLGGVLRAAFETKIALCALSDSGSVTCPPLALNPIALARLLLPEACQQVGDALDHPLPSAQDTLDPLPVCRVQSC